MNLKMVYTQLIYLQMYVCNQYQILAKTYHNLSSSLQSYSMYCKSLICKLNYQLLSKIIQTCI